MSRPFTRLAHAEATPGHCLRCPRNEDLIDLGAADLPGYGVAYLCTVCLGELLDAMGVITAEQHESVVLALRAQHERTEAQLADAIHTANPGTTLITDTLEELANGLDALARAAVRRLAAGPARDDRVPADAAVPLDAGVADVPLEAAGEQPGGDEEPLDADAAAAFIADLLGTGGDPVVPAGAAAGSARDARHDGDAGDELAGRDSA